MTIGTRRRPKPRFVSELPMRVPPVDPEDLSFDPLIEKLVQADRERLKRARTELLKISRDYKFSRDLALSRVSRSEVAETLRAIGKSARTVVNNIDLLTSGARAALEDLISGITALDWYPEIQAIDTLAELLEGTSEAADHIISRSSIEGADGLRVELEPFAAATRLVASQLGCFPDAAKWSLVLIQQIAPLCPSLEANATNLEFLRALCVNLNLLAEASAEVSKGDRGPRSYTAQMVAVERLKKLYEYVALDKATHSTHQGGEYKGGVRSDFAQFARIAFHSMESDPNRRRGLESAVSYAVWPCRPSGRSAKVQKERADLDRRTREALSRLSVTNYSF